MIFVCLGTQEFQFDRLLIKLGELVDGKVIQEEVFAQVGFSKARPSGITCMEFLGFEEFDKALESCRYVITHGGTGTIIKSLRKGKKVIAVPRLKKYGEHVDDHQKEIISDFSARKLVCGLEDVSMLDAAVRSIDDFIPEAFVSGNSKIISILDKYTESCR